MIELQFTCNVCGLTRERASVEERRHNQDVVVWLDGVMRELAVIHRRLRPTCRGEHLDVAIPTTGRPRIGGAVQH